MNKIINLSFLLLIVFTLGCYDWEVPTKCEDTTSSQVNLSKISNGVSALSQVAMDWTFPGLDYGKYSVGKTNDGTYWQVKAKPGVVGTVNINLSGTGKSTCGFDFTVSKSFSLCSDDVPTKINVEVIPYKGRQWINFKLDVSRANPTYFMQGENGYVRPIGYYGSSFGFWSTDYKSGTYTILGTEEDACGNTYTITSTPFRIDNFVELSYLGGSFKAGDQNSGSSIEIPASFNHKVSTFFIGKFEITQKQFKTLMGFNPSNKQNCDDCPVENVSALDAMNFCNALSQYYGYQPLYRSGHNNMLMFASEYGFRLPSEIEWEYAAGGGDIDRTKFGNNTNIANPTQINFRGLAEFKTDYSVTGVFRNETTKVGSFGANKLELYDMSGNVAEWCYGSLVSLSNLESRPTDKLLYSPFGEILNFPVRGGGFYETPFQIRAAFRHSEPGNKKMTNVGFRVVLNIPQ